MKRDKFFFVTYISVTVILLTIVNTASNAETNVIATLDDSPALVGWTALAVYEAVVRIVPTKSNNSILNVFFKFLHTLSERLNVKKN
jgi:hypothetical protein